MFKKIFIWFLVILAFISSLGFSTQNGELIECVSRQTTIIVPQQGSISVVGSVGAGNGTFNVDASGDITMLHGAPVTFPAANAVGFLKNDGAGNLSYENEWTYYRKTSSQEDETNSQVDVAGLGHAVEANKDYEFEIILLFYGDNVGRGIEASMNGPASPTTISFNIFQPSTTTASLSANATVYGFASAGTTSLASSATPRTCVIKGILRNGANAGTLGPTFCTSGAGAGYGIWVTAGSTARYRKTN
jgi:hypothetical protein